MKASGILGEEVFQDGLGNAFSCALPAWL